MESVDTRDLKSLARLSMRVRVPPVLPPTGHKDYYDKPPMIADIVDLREEEVFVYTRHGHLVNIKSLWR